MVERIEISDRIEVLYDPNDEYRIRIIDITAELIALTENEARRLYKWLKGKFEE